MKHFYRTNAWLRTAFSGLYENQESKAAVGDTRPKYESQGAVQSEDQLLFFATICGLQFYCTAAMKPKKAKYSGPCSMYLCHKCQYAGLSRDTADNPEFSTFS